MPANVYTPDQLSNEAYQELPQRSGSFLHRLLVHSPAKAKFGERPAGKALDFGIWSHAMILEPERFAQDYARDFDPSAYERLLVTATDMSAWLRERGLKISGLKADLVERIIETGEPVHLEPVECAAHRAKFAENISLVPPVEFDLITAMRHAILLDDERAKMLAGGFAELSIVTDEFKARPDLITGGQWVVNYKSTLDAEPQAFCRKATDYGYPMRAVMECELFKQAYGEYPSGYAILAQEKDAPYLCKTFVIYDRSRGDDQPTAWAYGRAQLADAVKLYRKCRDADVWPGLGGAEDLSVPDYIMKKAGLM